MLNTEESTEEEKGAKMNNKRKWLLQIARGKQPHVNKMLLFSVINGKKKLIEQKEISFDRDINIEIYAIDEEQLKLQEKKLKI